MADRKHTTELKVTGNAGSELKKVGVGAKMAAAAMTALVTAVVASIEVFSKQDEALGQLWRTYQQTGGSAREFIGTQLVLREQSKLTGTSIIAQRLALNDLLRASKDAAIAERDLALANNLSAGAAIGLEQAVKLVGKARVGDVEGLARLREISKNRLRDLTAEKDESKRTAMAMDILGESYDGAAGKTKGLSVAMANTKVSFENLMAAIGGASANGVGLDDELTNVSLAIDAITRAVKNLPKESPFLSTLFESAKQSGLGGATNSLLDVIDMLSESEKNAAELDKRLVESRKLRDESDKAVASDKSTGAAVDHSVAEGVERGAEEDFSLAFAKEDVTGAKRKRGKGRAKEVVNEFLGGFGEGESPAAKERRLREIEHAQNIRDFNLDVEDIKEQGVIARAGNEDKIARVQLDLAHKLTAIEAQRNRDLIAARQQSFAIAVQEAAAIGGAAAGAAGQVVGGQTGSDIANIGGGVIGAAAGFATGNVAGGVVGTLGVIGGIAGIARRKSSKNPREDQGVQSSSGFAEVRRTARIFAEENARMERRMTVININQDFSGSTNLESSQAVQRRVGDATNRAASLSLSRARRSTGSKSLVNL